MRGPKWHSFLISYDFHTVKVTWAESEPTRPHRFPALCNHPHLSAEKTAQDPVDAASTDDTICLYAHTDSVSFCWDVSNLIYKRYNLMCKLGTIEIKSNSNRNRAVTAIWCSGYFVNVVLLRIFYHNIDLSNFSTYQCLFLSINWITQTFFIL